MSGKLDSDESQRIKSKRSLARGTGIGIAIGAGMGVAIHNIVIGA